MTGGAFQISREIFDNDIWEDPIKFRIFFYLLGKAVWAEEGVKVAGVQLQRGQYMRSLNKLIEDLAYKEKNKIVEIDKSMLRRKIEALEKEGRITRKKLRSATVYTIVNYNEYQSFERYKKPKEVPVHKSEEPEATQAPAKAESAEHDLQTLLNRFIELRGKGLNYSPKDVAATQGILQEVPVEKAVNYLQEKFKAYKPKHQWDTITNLEYCAGFILDSYQKEIEIKNIPAGGGMSGKKYAASANGAQKQDSITGSQVGRLRRKQG